MPAVDPRRADRLFLALPRWPMSLLAHLAESLPYRVLVIDDERNIRATLLVCLEGMGCEVVGAGNAAEALAALAVRNYDFCFLDLKLGRENGLDLIPKLLAECPSLSIVIITAHATIDTAVLAIRSGARDYLPKPFTPVQIRHLVERGIERRALSWEVNALQERLAEAVPDLELRTRSVKLQHVLDTVERAAQSDAAVLLRGENGTGKGVLARRLHLQSRRKQRPLVLVNCPTLSGELLASELFGHVRGAFTGAVKDQPGRVEAAEGGTLFLDEVGELPPELQAKLLRFLQEKQFERVGDHRTRTADVRVIAATNRDLESDVHSGKFREDLLFRLNVLEITVPPLRERTEDILPLARHFLRFFSAASGRPPQELSPSAEEALARYSWPGNVRELRNVLERATILWEAPVIEAAAFPDRIHVSAPNEPFIGGDFALEAVEQAHILKVVARTATQDEAARILGVDASTLWRKRKKLDKA